MNLKTNIMETPIEERVIMFEDVKGYESKILEYEQYAKSVNEIAEKLGKEQVILTKKLFEDLHRSGTNACIASIEEVFNKEKSKAPDILKNSLQFNSAKYFPEYQNHVSALNWLRSQLRIDTTLYDVKNSECYLPEKSKQKLKELFTFRIENERQKVICDLIRQITGASFELCGVLKAYGFEPVDFIWNDRYGLLYPDYNDGTIKVNYIVLNALV